MHRLGLKTRSQGRRGIRGLALGLAGLVCLLAAGGSVAAPSPAKPQAAYAAQKPDPEVLLIDVYKELAANRLRQAQAKVDALVEAYPNFRLGHLIRGDLLLLHTRPITTIGAGASGSDDKLRQLRDEAMVRLKSLRERPDPDMVPRAILQLRDDQKMALIVDAKRSRLYVYENTGGQLKFVKDYYVSQGKLGVNKLKEGDQRTPIGVYYITARLPAARLPDFYGSGALPINYPNEWDKLHGRSGSGIWLHGTPSDSFSRPPLSSDGCVVLTNPDLHELASLVDIGKTPIVISENVEFVNKTKWNNERSVAARLTDGWRRDLASENPAVLAAHYSRKFKSERGEDLNGWFTRQPPLPVGAKDVSVRLRDVTYFYYPERDGLIVSTFTQEVQAGKSKANTLSRKRQYWAKEGAQWKIIYELNLSGSLARE
jgi:lipoprotein-anchoring transpeptidase ErfK/SrfK